MSKLAVVAIGGNSLIEDPKFPEMMNQWDAVRKTSDHLVDMIEQGWNIVVTHGNGPQVGYILRRSELASTEVHTVPLDIIVADTQGSIGYMLQQTIENELRRRKIPRRTIAVVTQTLVDSGDPAFQDPTKPIGGFMDAEKAELSRNEGWTVVEDSGRGYRRVVASPQPTAIIEEDQIRSLVEQGFIVVAVGGGGIPVVFNERGELRGVNAVIDKDRASALLSSRLNADLFLISTGVPQVAIHFNTPHQQWLTSLNLEDARRYYAEGHFAKGSMGPKIEAAITFLENGGKEALITSPANIADALAGNGGTWIRQ
jgi:carbamate kinase